jgi:hypothetical protein
VLLVALEAGPSFPADTAFSAHVTVLVLLEDRFPRLANRSLNLLAKMPSLRWIVYS